MNCSHLSVLTHPYAAAPKNRTIFFPNRAGQAVGSEGETRGETTMPDTSLNTIQMQDCVARWRAGDSAAADELLRSVGERLEHIAHNMLRAFPAVRSRADAGDVVQGSLLRLLKTLHRIEPESTRHFYNLAAVNVRRELLDLARRVRAERRAQLEPASGESLDGFAEAAAAPMDRGDDLEIWCRFHEAVEHLSPEEREVVGLVFYHGWTQTQIAELFQVDERTIRRRWQTACAQLKRRVGGRLPGR
jgi:RNA polymerase sigma factor (sigma-70 family)